MSSAIDTMLPLGGEASMPKEEETEGMRFEILKAAAGPGASARLGRLTLPQRQAVETPTFFAVTSRGAVPHLTPDNIARHGSFPGVYIAMEDLVDKSQKAVTKIPAAAKIPTGDDGKRLHAFTALPAAAITVLGPRRTPAIAPGMGNNDAHVLVFTSNGFQLLTNTAYVDAVAALRPDIAVPLADMRYAADVTATATAATTTATAAPAVGAQGLRRMCARTAAWVAQLRAALRTQEQCAARTATAVFAPTLPVPYHVQAEYLRQLAEETADTPSGLAVYDVGILSDLAQLPSLLPLPRLSLHAPDGPHEVLAQIAQGIDIFLLPFVNAASDAGVALTFTFPPPPPPPPPPQHPTTTQPTTTTKTTASDSASASAAPLPLLPLGDDLAAPAAATSLQPLAAACPCHACTAHHRAYVHHLLRAREMLAWTLLQLHNHAVAAAFLAGVRASLAAARFPADCRAFARRYAPRLPAGAGARPRSRGYHVRMAAEEDVTAATAAAGSVGWHPTL